MIRVSGAVITVSWHQHSANHPHSQGTHTFIVTLTHTLAPPTYTERVLKDTGTATHTPGVLKCTHTHTHIDLYRNRVLYQRTYYIFVADYPLLWAGQDNKKQSVQCLSKSSADVRERNSCTLLDTKELLLVGTEMAPRSFRVVFLYETNFIGKRV